MKHLTVMLIDADTVVSDGDLLWMFKFVSGGNAQQVEFQVWANVRDATGAITGNGMNAKMSLWRRIVKGRKSPNHHRPVLLTRFCRSSASSVTIHAGR